VAQQDRQRSDQSFHNFVPNLVGNEYFTLDYVDQNVFGVVTNLRVVTCQAVTSHFYQDFAPAQEQNLGAGNPRTRGVQSGADRRDHSFLTQPVSLFSHAIQIVTEKLQNHDWNTPISQSCRDNTQIYIRIFPTTRRRKGRVGACWRKALPLV
jgi:hypothetical protein